MLAIKDTLQKNNSVKRKKNIFFVHERVHSVINVFVLRFRIN